MHISRAVVAAMLISTAALAQAVGTSFTYQGTLSNGGVAVDGPTDLRFRLYDAATGGTASAVLVTHLAVDVQGGRFTVPLDFEVDAFTGLRRWLQIEVRPAGLGQYTILSPRQEVTPTPNAINASLLDGMTASELLGQGVPMPLELFPDDPLSWTLRANNDGPMTMWVENNSAIGNGIFIRADGTGLWSTANTATARAALFSGGTLGYTGTTVDITCGGTTSKGLVVDHSGSGDAATFTASLGRAAYFANTSSGNDNPVLYATTAGTGPTAHFRGNENDGTTGTLQLTTTVYTPIPLSSHMYLDSNEINVFNQLGGDTLWLNSETDGNVLLVAGGGNTGVGISNPEVRLHVSGAENNGTTASFKVTSGTQNLTMDGNEIDSDTNLYLNHNGASNVMLATGGGNVGIGTSSPARKLHVNGTARVDVLEITGADLAEKFPVSEAVEPGMVVAIDAAHPGQLCLARRAYDRRVAGIVSGGNDFAVGAVLGHLPGNDDAPPIALSGRVWVHCIGPVAVGDLLTTSDTPGHAMRVQDHTRAQGAIIGKAMTAHDGGAGMVLVLVSLQ